MVVASALRGQGPHAASLLPFRPVRRRVGPAGAAAAPGADRPAAHAGPAPDRGRPLLRPAHRLPVALPAGRLRPLVHRLLPLPPLARRRHLGRRAGRAAPRRAGPAGPAPGPERGLAGQPVGQDDRKRGPRGYDAGKRLAGRKRHLLTDTLGLALAAVVGPADEPDAAGGRAVLDAADTGALLDRLGRLWVDSAYRGAFAAAVPAEERGGD